MSNNLNIDIIKKIEPIFQELFLDDNLVITESTSPENIEEWDSLAHISLLSAIEQELKIQFTAEDMSNIQDVAGMLSVIKERGYTI